MPDEVQNTEETQDAGPSRVQKRIDQLTRRNTESQNLAAHETARADALAQQNAVLLQQIQSQTTPRPAQAPAPPTDPLAQFIEQKPVPQTPEQPAAPNIEAIIAQAVQAAVAPFVQREQVRAEETQLHAQQAASFDEALGFMPNLGTAGSLEQQIFDGIIANQPELRNIGNAPLLVANMVSGVLGAGGTQQVQETRKIAASPPTPAGTFDLSARLQDVTGPGDQAKKNENFIAAAMQKGGTALSGGDGTGLTPKEMEQYLGVKMGLANVK